MNKFGSYIVRKIDGSYVSAYSEALGHKNALSYAIDCAKFAKGNVFHRKAKETEEKIVAQYSDYKSSTAKE
jgi:hypothetical protein